MRLAHWGGVATAATFVFAAAGLTLADVVITHDRIGCVVAGSFPVVRARLEPPADVVRARVYFQARGTPSWYSVDMRGEGAEFAGTLPRPLESLRGFSYYIETLGPGLATSRSSEYASDVVGRADSCAPGLIVASAGAVPSALVVGVPQGAAPIPPGFSGLGLVTSAGGSAAGVAGAAATSGGGMSTGLLVGLGVAAAGGVALAVASGDDGTAAEGTAPAGSGPTGTPAPQPTPTPTPAPDISGRWQGQFVENASATQCSTTSDLTLNLQQSGTAVGGSFQLGIRTATPAPSDPCPVSPGEVYGGPLSGVLNAASLSLQLQISGGPTFFLNGTVSGNRISGTSPPDSDGPGGSWDVTRQ